MSPYWEFYSTNSLSSISAGKGNTGVASSGDVSLIYLNPATLNISKKFQVNAGYNLKTGTDNLSQNFYSFSIAGAYRLNKNFQVGLAYQNDYSYDYSPSIVFDWPYINTLETHSFRIPIVYNHKLIRMGLNLNLIYFKSSSYDCISENLWKLNPEVGAIVTPIQEFSIGASFIPGFTGNPNIINNCGGENTYVSYVKFPNRFKAGMEVSLFNNNLKLSFDYHYANTGSIEYLKDQSNYHIGLDYIIDENWVFRCGYFTMFDFEEKTYPSKYSDDLYFATFGTTYKVNNYSINLGAIGSMSGHSGGRDYLLINFGAGYEF
jgi:long-subunit fatty acid transport protein